MRYGFERSRTASALSKIPVIGNEVEAWYNRYLETKYELNWRYLANPASSRKFNKARPVLSDLQTTIVNTLRTVGVAVTSFTALLSADLWAKASADVQQFAASSRVARSLEHYQQARQEALRLQSIGGEVDAELQKVLKRYFITLYAEDERPLIRLDNIWLQIGLHPNVLDIVNSYFAMWSKLTYFDLWHTVPVPTADARFGSQLWHRDPEDRRKVRIYVYFRDVDEGSGPLEYIPGSALGGPYQDLWGWHGALKNPYPPQDEIDRRFPREQRVLCTGKAGTMIFCDTFGFHRGGVSTSGVRLLATWQYVTPASLHQQRYDIDWNSVQNGRSLSALQRFTIS